MRWPVEKIVVARISCLIIVFVCVQASICACGGGADCTGVGLKCINGLVRSGRFGQRKIFKRHRRRCAVIARWIWRIAVPISTIASLVVMDTVKAAVIRGFRKRNSLGAATRCWDGIDGLHTILHWSAWEFRCELIAVALYRVKHESRALYFTI